MIRDTSEVIDKVRRIAHAIKWTVEVYDAEPESSSREKILVATKQLWINLPTSS